MSAPALPRHSTTRSIVKAMGMFGSVKAITLLCSLVRNKLIAIWIGASGVGLVLLFNSLIELISTLCRLNIDQSAMREVARADHNEVPVIGHVVLRWSIWLGTAGMLAMCALSPWLSEINFGTSELWWQFCLLSVVPLLYALICAYGIVLQGTRQFARLAKASLWTALLGIMVSVPLIWFLRYNSIIWLIVSYAALSFLATYKLRQKLPRLRLTARQVWHKGSDFVRLGIYISLAVGITQLLQYVFVLYLNHFASTSTLGLYQAGYTVINSYVGVIFTGIWIEYYPRLSAQAHSPRRTALTVSHQIITCSLIVMPVTALLVACDELIVRILYADSFLDMLPFITIGIVGITLRATSWCLAHVILARGNGRIYLITETLSAVAMLAMNVAGYRWGGFAGLGIAYVLWYGLYTLITLWVYMRIYHLTLTRNAWLLAAGAAVFALICLIAKLMLGWWAALILAIGIAPITYRRLLS